MKTIQGAVVGVVNRLPRFTVDMHTSEWAYVPPDVQRQVMVVAAASGCLIEPADSTIVAWASSATGDRPDLVACALLTAGREQHLQVFSTPNQDVVRKRVVSHLVTSCRLPVTSRLLVDASDSVTLTSLVDHNFVGVTALFP